MLELIATVFAVGVFASISVVAVVKTAHVSPQNILQADQNLNSEGTVTARFHSKDSSGYNSANQFHVLEGNSARAEIRWEAHGKSLIRKIVLKF